MAILAVLAILVHCLPAVLIAQTIHRSRAIDSVTMRDGRMVVAATSDSIVLVTIRSRDRTVDAVPSIDQVVAFLDSASRILAGSPTRAFREDVSYSVSGGGLLFTRSISDRGESVRIAGIDLDRTVEVSANPPQAARILQVLRDAARVTAQMTAADHPQTFGGLDAPVLTDAPRADSLEPTYFEYQVDRPAASLPGNARPPYPDALRSAGEDGEVLAQFVVDADGRADSKTFRVLRSTHVLFASAVKATLPSWRFSPAEVDGRRVRQLVQMSFEFPVADAAIAATPTERFEPPSPVPDRLRGFHLVAEFDVDKWGEADLLWFTRTRDERYNDRLEDALNALTFRPGTTDTGVPVRSRVRITYDF